MYQAIEFKCVVVQKDVDQLFLEHLFLLAENVPFVDTFDLFCIEMLTFLQVISEPLQSPKESNNIALVSMLNFITDMTTVCFSFIISSLHFYSADLCLRQMIF